MSLLKIIKSNPYLKHLLLAGVLLIVFVLFVLKWLNISTNHNQKIEVPDLSKKSLANVEQILDELNLKLVVIDSASYNPDFPKKSVIDQNPDVGDFVKENRKIYLTLNPSGYRNVTIPEFYGKTKRNITASLKAIGFRVGNNPMYVPDKGKDVVRGLKFKGEKLKEGDKLPKNSLIELILGDGRGQVISTEDSEE